MPRRAGPSGHGQTTYHFPYLLRVLRTEIHFAHARRFHQPSDILPVDPAAGQDLDPPPRPLRLDDGRAQALACETKPRSWRSELAKN